MTPNASRKTPAETEASSGRTGFALGDIERGIKYRLITPGEEDWYPQVAVFSLVEMPTGNQKLGFSTWHAQVFPSLWLQQEFDPWTVYGGGGYWINPSYGNKNYGFFGVAVCARSRTSSTSASSCSTRPHQPMACRTPRVSMSAPSTKCRRIGTCLDRLAPGCRTGRRRISCPITSRCN